MLKIVPLEVEKGHVEVGVKKLEAEAVGHRALKAMHLDASADF